MKITIENAQQMTNKCRVMKTNFKMSSKKIFKKTNRVKKEQILFYVKECK